MPRATVLPVFVLYGKDQDVAIREYDKSYDPTVPNAPFPGHALFAFGGRTHARLKQILQLFAPPMDIADASEKGCKGLATTRIQQAFPEGGWQAGEAYIIGRKVDAEGHWILGQGAAADEFSFGFRLQKRNANGEFEDYTINLPARSGTFLVARALVHVQSAV